MHCVMTLIGYSVSKRQAVPDVLIVLVYVLLSHHAMFESITHASNDIWGAVTFAAACWYFQRGRMTGAAVMAGLSVGLKMSWLLLLPAAGVSILCSLHRVPRRLLGCVSAGATVVVLPALPFLLHSPLMYLNYAYNFGRDFTRSNNFAWRFLEQSVVSNSSFKLALLVLTAASISGVCFITGSALLRRRRSSSDYRCSVAEGQLLCSAMILSVWCGVAFSRGIHSQFLLWVSWTLPIVAHSFMRLPALYSMLFCFLYDEAYRRPGYDMVRVCVLACML